MISIFRVNLIHCELEMSVPWLGDFSFTWTLTPCFSDT
jgi:hypothetical protein